MSHGIARDRIGNIDETSTALLLVDVAGWKRKASRGPERCSGTSVVALFSRPYAPCHIR